MSVVAWDGKTLAADRQATNADMRVKVSKAMRLQSGSIAAFTGDLEQGLILVRWYQDGACRDKWPAFQRSSDWTRLIIADRYDQSSSVVLIYEKEPEPQTFDERFMAWGSGRDLAMGAMAMGADAKRAVEIASMYNVYCGGGVDVFDLR